MTEDTGEEARAERIRRALDISTKLLDVSIDVSKQSAGLIRKAVKKAKKSKKEATGLRTHAESVLEVMSEVTGKLKTQNAANQGLLGCDSGEEAFPLLSLSDF